MLRNENETNSNPIKSAENAASALCFCVLLIMALSDLAIRYFSINLDKTILLISVSAISFALPALVFFIWFKKADRLSPKRNTYSVSSLRFCLPAGLLLVFSNILTQSILYYVSGSPSADGNHITNIGYVPSFILYAVLPAVLEEIVFRGVAFRAYEKSCGGIGAILATSLFFAGIHFSAGDFVTYFLAGAILGTVVYITRSIYSVILLHFINNTVSFYLQNAVFKIASESKSGFLAIFIVAAISVLCLLWTISELENICQKKYIAASQYDGQADMYFAKLLPDDKKTGEAMSAVFCSPFLWAGAIVFIIFCLI